MSLKSFLNRREFLKKTTKGAIGLAAGLTASGMVPLSRNKMKGEVKKNPNSIKVALYSVTFSGVWYDGPSLTIKELIPKAKSMGYDGIEIGAKRPHASPLDLDKQDCTEIRRLADSKGIEICALSSYNNFTSPIVEQREYELLMLREQMRITNYLGVKILRIFASWNGITMENGKAVYGDARRARSIAFPKVTREQRWNWCRECLEESVKYAKKFGVIIALQNHKPLMDNYKDTIKMVNEIGSDNLKITLDVPLFNFQDDKYVRNAVKETGTDLIVHSHFGGEYDRKIDGRIVQRKLRPDRKDVNYPVFVEALAEIGYNGYLSYELCHPFKVEGKYCKLEDSKEQSALAIEYMRNIISKVL